jgi:hypothetical protein
MNFDYFANPNAGKTFHREEIKYCVRRADIPELLDLCGSALRPDEHAVSNSGYMNYSIYYDTRDLRFFREKVEGLSRRTKPRIRIYKNPENEEPLAHFLELKNRYDGYGGKDRAIIDGNMARRMLEPFWRPSADELASSETIGKFCYLQKRFDLVPVNCVLYFRQAFKSNLYPGFRLTIDSRIRASTNTKPDNPFEHFRPVLGPELAILEVKHNDGVPGWFLNATKKMELTRISFSKYCVSIAQLYSRSPVLD